jgi:hypothetical protein
MSEAPYHHSYRVYVVEVGSKTSGHLRWSAYSWHAFNDAREPETKRDGYGSVFGTFDTIKRNLRYADHPSRIQDGFKAPTRNKPAREPHTIKGLCGRDIIAFTDKDAALAYAAQLRKYGRWAYAWNAGDHNLALRETPMLVRVVEEQAAIIRAVVPVAVTARKAA